MAQMKNFKFSKGAATPSASVGTDTKKYGTGTARNNTKPVPAAKSK